ncbi:cytochrome c biogenesis protein CcdA/thiol-disulfide isomerase/thioredoxin [Azospirillum lipoferum]|uniref:Cytochrome c biogenesis protein DipZ n=1 Tax=Azospirillum lipoferum TaxID=193 RepID=A0A5A9GRP6_AZOLI|nr:MULTISPECIES: cytochrome c biogenesis protein DipZ [Azospirillum]KAA0595989.1 cytochrome c biogenesis protein DipZ [Azospirillum lipoferum]MCP1610895.1 cytochrome c biogenesis protein CcdA/thiol-disulfide isomerase/thioredoxin [Azospirillum lipoferum]MDW5533960.1 cytochrome c biogenesis protein DipZ [Azospirillum sp. NL1]
MILFLVSFLAGALTIVSPCILPVVPFVFSRAGQPLFRGILPMLFGMVASFAGVATLSAVGGGWAVEANGAGRAAAIALMAVFGWTLLSPRAAAMLSRPLVAVGNRLSGRPAGVAGSLLLGVATGLLWAPCAGPILGLVLTGAALHGASLQTTLLLAAYAAGAATSLALTLLAGGRLLAAMKRSLGIGERLRQGLGIAVLAGVGVIALGLDTGLLARLSYAGTSSVEQSLIDRFAPAVPSATAATSGAPETSATGLVLADARRVYRSSLPVEGVLPSLDGATDWLNSKPLTTDELRGKVVLIDFWTYSCINCIRTLPYLRAWAEKYRDQGLVVVGVHAPEFAFEKRIGNVQKALRDFAITYPVAVDNDFRIWRAFGNSYWPAFYIADATGRIRHHQFGEGGYEQTERVIQDLLAEAAGGRAAGGRAGDGGLVSPAGQGAQAPADLDEVRSGETYVGYRQAANFASPERDGIDRPQDYTVGALRLNHWGLSGNWTVGPEQARLNWAGGTIVYRFRARDLHLILGPARDGRPVRFQVTIDGMAPGPDHGTDTDAEGYGTVSETRLYQLVRQAGAVRERTFEVRFLDPGVDAYAFTFG